MQTPPPPDVVGTPGAGPPTRRPSLLTTPAPPPVSMTDPGAQTATVTYGDAVAPVTRPGRAPAHVTEFTAPDSTEKFCKAIDALDGALALALSHPGAARLLVIISDGAYTTDERASGKQRLARLARTGCGVLWLAPDTRWSDPMAGAQTVTITDPAATAETIAKAATRALQTA